MDITEDVAKSVPRKLLGISGIGGTDSEALQGWILKFVEHSKRLLISVETFIDWLDNQNPPWAAYRSCMPGRLIALKKIWVFVQSVSGKSGDIFFLSV